MNKIQNIIPKTEYMLQAKQGVLDRIEQSFGIFMKNPVALVMPLAIFQVVMISVLPQIAMGALFGGNFMETSNISTILYMTISLALVYAMFYVLLIIPITIAVIKGASDLIDGKNIIISEMLSYGWDKISDSFKVYWFMFSYAYLMPALCFIAAGFTLLYGLYFGVEILRTLGGIGMGISVLYGLIQGIYRGLRASFAIGSAIYENDFSKEQFYRSINVTEAKWWRILGNLVLIGIISGLLMGLITGLLSSINFLSTSTSGLDIQNIMQTGAGEMQKSIDGYIDNLGGVALGEIVMSSISQILGAIVSAFTIVFTLIFYIRLKQESSEIKNVKQESYIVKEL